MRTAITIAATLALGIVAVACSAVTLLFAWAAAPFDVIRSACADRVKRLAESVRDSRSTP